MATYIPGVGSAPSKKTTSRSGRSGGGTFNGVQPKSPVPSQTYTAPSTVSPPNLSRNTNFSVVPNTGTGTSPYSGGGGPGLDGGVAPQITPPSDEDYLAGDSGYTTQLSALQSALQRYLADSDFQKNTYSTDYNKSLRDLGYDEGSKNWNWNDKLTASGRGYQNQLDDFASRGMLQSQGYADAFSELQRMLGQQYDSMAGAKTNFMTDLDNQIANYKAENTSNIQAARAEALNRRALGQML